MTYYIRVEWNHGLYDEPVVLYSECDTDNWEIRKVEEFRNGKMGFADKHQTHLGTRLSIERLPELKQISRQAEFKPSLISQEEFERVWALASKARTEL